MAVASTASSGSSPPEVNPRALHRLHSLFGVVPLGGFLVLHLLSMLRALWGREAFDAVLFSPSRLRLGVELGLLGVPLLVHVGVGLVLVARPRRDERRYSEERRLAHLLQRVTGLLALGFIGAHLWHTRGRVLASEIVVADLYGDLGATLSATSWLGVPWLALVYLAGLGATVYHFANGLLAFSASFELVRSETGRRKLAWACALGGAGLFVLGAASVLYFATGSPSFAGSSL